MDTEEAEVLVTVGKEMYQRLLDEATGLLRNLDSCSPEAVGEAVQRRQALIDELQVFDAKVARIGTASRNLEEYRIFQEQITVKILEMDGLVIALTREKQASIKRKMSAMSKSLTISQAYEKGDAVNTSSMNDCV